MLHVAQHALGHHVVHGLIKLAVAALQAHLHGLFRTRGGQRAQRVNFFRLEYQALFAEHMLARFERVLGHAEMLIQRHRDQHRVNVLGGQ